jgi:DNA replication protein DnaC
MTPGIPGRTDCPDCAGQGYTVGREIERAHARRCACVARCPLCRGSGWTPADDSPRPRMRRCVCTVLDDRISAFNQANIPGRHAHSTRNPSSFRPSRPVMPAIAAVSRFLKEFRPQEENRGLILHGDVGRGKTHLLVAMLRELALDHGVSCRFVEFSHLLSDLKAGFDNGTAPSILIEPLVRVEILAIDELGKGQHTDWALTVLDELVSRRYNAGKTILGTTNHPPGPPSGVSAGNLALGELLTLGDRVGARVYSRLRGMCDFCTVEGEDFREQSATRDPARRRAPPRRSDEPLY